LGPAYDKEKLQKKSRTAKRFSSAGGCTLSLEAPGQTRFPANNEEIFTNEMAT
jgi:hypothetical protein